MNSSGHTMNEFNAKAAHFASEKHHMQQQVPPPASGLAAEAFAEFGPPPTIQQQQDDEDNDSPLFATDEFRVWCMKVIPCTKRFVHDWTVCPFAHAGEKAVRRDPRTHNYTGIACPDMKKLGNCIRSDRCPYAHNVFEYWLHPTRYRTQLCNDGPVCRRGICFFAHSLDELRVPACKPYVSPEALARASVEAIQANPHPLSAQLPMNPVGAPTSSAQQQQQQQGGGYLTPAAQQQAALAALSRPSYGHPNMQNNANPSPFTMGTPPSPVVGSHVGAEPPRISVGDYGSLPRWSDSAPFIPQSMQQQQNAGRFSYNSDYGSACSTPARISSSNPNDSIYAGEALKSVPENGVSSVRSSSGSGNSSGGSPRQSSGVPNDDELAHSLATLKIALTQQNAAASTASNHEVVISTLHQILREAVAQQTGAQQQSSGGSGGPSEEDASAVAAAAYAALANSMAAFTGGQSPPSAPATSLSVSSEVSVDNTSGRMSLESIQAANEGVEASHLSNDLVGALN